MPPPSIQRFTRFFLVSIALGGALAFGTFAELKASLVHQDPTMGNLSDEVLALALGLGLAVMVILWFLISRQGSNLAKWVLVALTVVSILLQLPKMGPILTHLDWKAIVSLLAAAGQLYAIAQLFRADAVAWLSHEKPVEHFDIG